MNIRFQGLNITALPNQPARAEMLSSRDRQLAPGEVRVNGETIIENDTLVKSLSQAMTDHAVPWHAALREILLKGVLKQVLETLPLSNHSSPGKPSEECKAVTVEQRVQMSDLTCWGQLLNTPQNRDCWTLELTQPPRKPGIS